jgi:hypothetical protein
MFLESVQNVLCGGEIGEVDVVDSTNFTKEKAQIVLFGKPGKLGRVVQPNIDDPLYTYRPKRREEAVRRRFRKADGE